MYLSKDPHMQKGDGKVWFSGQQRQLLRNLKSNFDEILHDGQLFGVLSGNVEFLAIQPQLRLFWNTTLSAEKKFKKHICAQNYPLCEVRTSKNAMASE